MRLSNGTDFRLLPPTPHWTKRYTGDLDTLGQDRMHTTLPYKISPLLSRSLLDSLPTQFIDDRGKFSECPTGNPWHFREHITLSQGRFLPRMKSILCVVQGPQMTPAERLGARRIRLIGGSRWA